MNGEKAWYRSKTIWAGVVMILATLIGVLFKKTIDAQLQAQLTELIVTVVDVVAGATAIYGRATADKTLGTGGN